MEISELVRGQKYKFWKKVGEPFSVIEFIDTDIDGDPHFVLISGMLERKTINNLYRTLRNTIRKDSHINNDGDFTWIIENDFNNGECSLYSNIGTETNLNTNKNDTMSTFNAIQVAKFFENKKNVKKIEIMDGELGKFVELFTKSISVLEKMEEKAVELHEEFTKALDSDNYKEIKKLLGKNPELMEFMEVFSENKIFSIGESEEKETENVGEFFNL